MNYTSTVPVIVDLYLAVLLNPRKNPDAVVSKAAKTLIRKKVALNGSGNLMLIGLAKSKMAYRGLKAGVQALEHEGIL